MLPAGEYYIGDLCYVFSHPKWDELLAATNYLQNDDGVFQFGNILLACYGTAYGDGTYADNNLDVEIGVDSGTIGCMLLTDIEPEMLDRAKECGAIYTFTKPFKTYEEDGTIRFGNRWIDTDPEPEYEEDDWDEEEDDD